MAESFNLAEAVVEIVSDPRKIYADFKKIMAESETFAAGLSASITMLAQIAIPVGIGMAIYKLGADAVESANHIHELSEQIGISTENLSRWEYAGKTVGLTVDDIGRAVGLLARQMVKGTNEAGQASKGLENLGLTAKATGGGLKTTDEMLGEIAEKFVHMEDGPLKTAAALEIFGRSGRKMIPLLNMGKEGLDKLKKAADDAGYTLSEETTLQAHQFSVQVAELEMRAQGVARTIMADVVPALIVLTADMHDAADATGKLYHSDDNLIEYFTRVKAVGVELMATLRSIIAALVMMAKVATSPLPNPGTFILTTDYFKETYKKIIEYYKAYQADLKRIGAVGVDALEVTPDDPNKKKDTRATDQHTESIDKLNRSLQMNILQMKLKNAEMDNDYYAQEKLSAAIRAVTNYDDIQAGADKDLVAIAESMAAAIEHRTLMLAKQTEKEKEAAKAAQLRLKLQSDAEAAEKSLTTALDDYYKHRDALANHLETFMRESQKRMLEATLDEKAHEVAVVDTAHEKRIAQIQQLLDEEKVSWDEAKKMVLQSEAEKVAELGRIDEKYATGWHSLLQRIARYTKDEEKATAKEYQKLAESLVNSTADTFGNTFWDLLTGKKADALTTIKNFFRDFAKEIVMFLARQEVLRLFQMMGGMDGGGGGGGGWLAMFAGLFGGKGGGYTGDISGVGGSGDFGGGFAEGGIATHPMISSLAEDGQPEGIVPLSRGRYIDVKLTRPGNGGDVHVTEHRTIAVVADASKLRTQPGEVIDWINLDIARGGQTFDTIRRRIPKG